MKINDLVFLAFEHASITNGITTRIIYIRKMIVEVKTQYFVDLLALAVSK